MAAETEMVYVRMPEVRGRRAPTFKINPRDSERVKELVEAGGEIIRGNEKKASSKSSKSKASKKDDDA